MFINMVVKTVTTIVDSVPSTYNVSHTTSNYFLH
jgi:hypothetical protein